VKYLVKFFVITASLFFITHSYADTKIAFIDMDKILNESKAGKTATLELNELNKKNLEILQKTEKKLKEDEAKLIAKRNLMETSEFEKQIKHLRENAKLYQLDRKNKLDEINNKYNLARSKILDEIKPILEKFSKDNNINIVVQKKYIIIGSTNLDITPHILKLLDEKISSIKLN
tara:strand:+ start:44 stop:568 length:525 start_codon:yes stop_codon:yes gene_type:complete